ncbi:MAG TPA: aminotransferase class V-fold PLP-dependent enzyme [Cyclobacteriaceae bacterium]|nr:aminotransferase class V-fold PLP-dependent enzyme [Cyclobacteriaceae bacterium]
MIQFSPGPSQLYFTVKDHVKEAFRNDIPSLSHRTKTFESFYQEVKDGLRELLSLPSNYSIYFTSSANEIWERSIQNLVEEKSHHFINGAFSKRHFEISLQLGKKATKTEVPMGKSFGPFEIPNGTELIALTHNETSTGVSLDTGYIQSFKSKYPGSLVIVDAVSSLPYPDFDYNQLDSVYFSVQKGFGLPAGLGVWIVNDRCLAKAEQLLAKGKCIGSYHTLPQLQLFALKNQTPETPNVLGIYLLSKVIGDFVRKGITALRKETEYKAAILYHVLDNHPSIKPFISAKSDRSKTVIIADSGNRTEALTTYLLEKGIYPGEGYGTFKKQHLRFANFPTHSKEQFESLVDVISAFH